MKKKPTKPRIANEKKLKVFLSKIKKDGNKLN